LMMEMWTVASLCPVLLTATSCLARFAPRPKPPITTGLL
jgi:hypothetical protein